MKKNFLFPISIFLICLLIDQLTKTWGLQLPTLHYNEGFIFGIYKDIPDFLRTITLSTIFGFIFFAYISLLYLLPVQLYSLKLSLSIFVGGISGNVLDRTFHGLTIDFIPLSFLGFENIYFNIADVLQVIGACLITYQLIRQEKIIWHPSNLRRNYLLHPNEQIRLSISLMAITYCSSLLLGLFSLSFLRLTLLKMNVENINSILLSFGLSFLSLSFLFSLCVFIAGILISHRISGPLHAFESFTRKLIKGEDATFSLRQNDYYRRLERLAIDFKAHFKGKED